MYFIFFNQKNNLPFLLYLSINEKNEKEKNVSSLIINPLFAKFLKI